jgi:hypothetical protein
MLIFIHAPPPGVTARLPGAVKLLLLPARPGGSLGLDFLALKGCLMWGAFTLAQAVSYARVAYFQNKEIPSVLYHVKGGTPNPAICQVVIGE